MDDLSINQRVAPQGEGWWAWEVWLDGPDAALDKVAAVVYTLHPTFPDSRRRVTDRASRFSLRAGGWGEFMISAEVPRWRRYISVAQANARWPASDA